MGWTNSHLYEFRIKNQRYADPTLVESFDDRDTFIDTRTAICGNLLPLGAVFSYQYDFGDDWQHRIMVTEIGGFDENPAGCSDGARACPPEDCGGTDGYLILLNELADQNNAGHESAKEWAGPFDPELFSLHQADIATAFAFRAGLLTSTEFDQRAARLRAACPRLNY